MLGCVALALLLLVLGWRRPQTSHPKAAVPSSPSPSNPTWPPAVILAPMAGLVPELDALLAALEAQDYPDFEVVLVIESAREARAEADEAAVRLAARERAGLPPGMRVVRAEPSVRSSQKCQNLIAGWAAASPRAEVVAMIDADAIPHRTWLRDLVRPLLAGEPGAYQRKPAVSTGFRWYVPGKSLPGLVRSAFSATALAVVADPVRAFAWGGSLAITRQDFTACGIPAAWASALSDDLAVTRAVRAAGGRVQFVPDCIVPSFGDPTWRGLLEFVTRQLTMLRWGSPKLWGEILAFHVALVTTQLAAFALALGVGHVPGGEAGRWAALLVLAAPSLAAMGRTAVRLRGLRQRPLARVAGWDRGRHLHVALSPFIAWIVLGAALSAGLRREVTWCGIRYRVRSNSAVEVAAGPVENRHAA
jgi:hypothetical protein